MPLCRQRCHTRTLQHHLLTRKNPTIPPFIQTIPPFFTVSWATFSKSESRRTLTGCTTTFYFLNGCAWVSTPRKISSVSLGLLQRLVESLMTSGSSTGTPAGPRQHRVSVPLAFTDPYLHRLRAIPDLYAPTLTIGRDCRVGG